MERVGGRLLDELGYDPENSQGDWAPPAAHRRWWTLQNDLYLAGRSLVTEFRFRGDRRWDSFGNRVRSAIRQRLTSRF